ncbi:hypothetical protein GALMADRAFT_247916 [Galerina marginata CBS 339.88]|uniref:Uncharacterized protein n=1 Tax=Galerina marginata (strain CBS 339.88) TaxID=685588 RepID=A0A067T6G1_GALM3|nr:hypothetical protein GALMADRAFT_247916 [Galerina marginata CBS 339.88]
MIYSNTDTPTPPKQGPSSPPPPRGEGQQSPPSYGSSQAYPQVQPYPQTYTGYAVVVPPPQTAGRRFIGAFLVATLIWFLFTVLIQSTFGVVRWSHRHGGLILDGWDYTIPSGVSLQECIQGGEWSPSLKPDSSVAMAQGFVGITFPRESETSFDLPLSSKSLFFLSRGQLLGGAVNVITSTNQPKDTATVQVVIKYRREEVRDLAKVCMITRNQGENGVGIFAPVWPLGRYPHGQEYRLGYKMTIILPDLTGKSAPLVIKNFETDVQNSVHQIADLNDKVLFESISLSGSNGPITAGSLAVIKGKIHTSNGQISGNFNSTTGLTVETSNAPVSGKFNSKDLSIKTSNGQISGVFNSTTVLTLLTSNAPIRVAVGLESKGKGATPILNARTSNGMLEADVSLISGSSSGGSFNVTTTSSNAPLRVTFPASPLNSKLNFNGWTSNGRATALLNPAYEGDFSLQTSSTFGVTVHRNAGVEDPTGEERKRQIVYRTVGKGVLTGEIHWDTKQKGQGLVTVRTSNSPIVLEV